MKLRSKIFIPAILILVTMSLSSCKVLRPSDMFQEHKDHPILEFKPSEKEYKIKPFDILSVRITTNDGFSLIGLGAGSGGGSEQNNRMLQKGIDYLVEFDGMVKLPTIGRIDLSGKTIREAEAFLEEQYTDFYQSPFVLLEVSNRKVFIFYNSGTIARTVKIPPENLTLIEAISNSGGLTEISRSYKIKLIRGDITDNPEVYYWNLSSLDDIKNTNILLEANDVIYVDSKPQYILRILKELTPYLTLATTALSVYGIFFKK